MEGVFIANKESKNIRRCIQSSLCMEELGNHH